MLLDLKQLIETYNLKITGVIQAGAHQGGEVDLFKEITKGEIHLFEPCEDSYELLMTKVFDIDNTYCYNYALGSIEAAMLLEKETANNGQSNSLLAPKKHLEYYPNIKFEEYESVTVQPLDIFDICDCNFLVIDVQGYELEVLKGATETLKHIDYILTEVNREELYEGCAMVEDLDNYLTDFIRVKTKWVRKGWGDALYISKKLL